jgi:hypothetical protein
VADGTLRFKLNGRTYDFEVVKVTAREPQSGAVIDVQMSPNTTVPFVYGFTPEQVEDICRIFYGRVVTFHGLYGRLPHWTNDALFEDAQRIIKHTNGGAS